MTLKVQLVILPAWLEDALKSNNMTSVDALDLMSLSRILSLQDVAFYRAIHNELYGKIYEGIRTTFQPLNLSDASGALTRPYPNGNRPSPEEVATFMTRLDRCYFDNMTAATPTGKAMLSALPHEAAYEHTRDGINEYLFEVFPIKDDYYGIRFSIPDPQRGLATQLIECYDRVISMLLGHYSFEDIASTSLFCDYTRLLRSVNVD